MILKLNLFILNKRGINFISDRHQLNHAANVYVTQLEALLWRLSRVLLVSDGTGRGVDSRGARVRSGGWFWRVNSLLRQAGAGAGGDDKRRNWFHSLARQRRLANT